MKTGNLKIRIFIILLPLVMATTIRAESGKDINWKEEIGGLKRELTARHPDLYFNLDSVSFNNRLDQVAERAGEKSTLEVAVMLQQVVAQLGDAQTKINYHFLIDNNLS